MNVVKSSLSFDPKPVYFVTSVELLWTLLEISESALSAGLLAGDNLYVDIRVLIRPDCGLSLVETMMEKLVFV